MKQASLKDGKIKAALGGRLLGFSGVWRSLGADAVGMSAHYCANRMVPAFTLVLVFMTLSFRRFATALILRLVRLCSLCSLRSPVVPLGL